MTKIDKKQINDFQFKRRIFTIKSIIKAISILLKTLALKVKGVFLMFALNFKRLLFLECIFGF